MKSPPTIGAATITNCTFEYECPKDWFKLTPTDAPDVRHCDACEKDVTFCADDARLLQMVRAGACVAVYARRVRTIPASSIRMGFPKDAYIPRPGDFRIDSTAGRTDRTAPGSPSPDSTDSAPTDTNQEPQ